MVVSINFCNVHVFTLSVNNQARLTRKTVGFYSRVFTAHTGPSSIGNIIVKFLEPLVIPWVKSLHFILAQSGNSIIATACPLKSS